jgi:hypothetical protein
MLHGVAVERKLTCAAAANVPHLGNTRLKYGTATQHVANSTTPKYGEKKASENEYVGANTSKARSISIKMPQIGAHATTAYRTRSHSNANLVPGF